MKPTKPSRVLVPVDNSKNSWRVIDHAIKFAKTTGAEITVLYVVPTKYKNPNSNPLNLSHHAKF